MNEHESANQAPSESYACARCTGKSDITRLAATDYRCPHCGLELAHIDFAPNGMVRGVFGYLRTVGEVIHDRYLIREVLGKGGFGATYLVDDLRLNRKRRALKEIPLLVFDEYEVTLLSNLVHPCIPDILDRFSDDSMMYLVLEFGGNRTLRSECERQGGRILPHLLIPWLLQLCEAIHYLHNQNPPVIHRDMKPDNILLDENNRIMLVDFGIAKESAPAQITRRVAHAASHGFSPPEQLMGTGTDERSDIYSLGATAYFLLTGHVPPAADERISGKALEPPSSFIPGLAPQLDDLLLWTLELNANQRPNNIQEVRALLDSLDFVDASESTAVLSRTIRIPSKSRFLGDTSDGVPIAGIKIPTAELLTPKVQEAPKISKRKIWIGALLFLGFCGTVTIAAYYYLVGAKPPLQPSVELNAPPTIPPEIANKTPEPLERERHSPVSPPPLPSPSLGKSASEVLKEARYGPDLIDPPPYFPDDPKPKDDTSKPVTKKPKVPPPTREQIDRAKENSSQFKMFKRETVKRE